MYHDVPANPSGSYFAVSRQRFAAHLDAIAPLGVPVSTLEEAGPGKVAVTFDDGLATHYSEVFPLLAERGMRATFFVTTGWVGQRGYVTWTQLREMAAAGMSIQSHTASHPFLSELDRAGAERELTISRLEIENRLGSECSSLALPGGDAPVEWSLADYARLGYHVVATSRWGPNTGTVSGSSPRFARRYTVRGNTGDTFVPALALAGSSAFSLEALRLLALNVVRRALGAGRYHRYRGYVIGGRTSEATATPVINQDWVLEQGRTEVRSADPDRSGVR